MYKVLRELYLHVFIIWKEAESQATCIFWYTSISRLQFDLWRQLCGWTSQLLNGCSNAKNAMNSIHRQNTDWMQHSV